MNIKKYRKRKIDWTTTYVFGGVCYDYLKTIKVNEKNVIKLEKILFLMQFYSLEEFDVPLLTYKTYYYNGKIYLKYLSDMIRVASSDLHGDINFEKVNKKYRYNDILKKYMILSEKELNDSINELVKVNKFNSKYFKFEECRHEKFFRKCARFQVSFLGGTFMLFGSIALANVVILILTIIMFILKTTIGYNGYPLKEGIGAVIISSPALIGCYFLLKKMIKPTKFEIEHEFYIKN